MNKINDSFLAELFKAALVSPTILDIVTTHLKFELIPSQPYKLVFQKMVQQYELNNEVPTIGSLSQHFSREEEVLSVLKVIQKVNVSDKKETLLSTFEKYLIDLKFVDLYTQIGGLYNDGKKDKALKLLATESAKITSFSIKDKYYTKLFQDFESRQEVRKKKLNNGLDSKIPFSIHALDYYTRGGMKVGTSTLILALSGVGKSTILRWIGASAARLGFRVVHFQGEGTEQECLDNYDATWTGVNTEDIEFGILPKDRQVRIEKARQDIISTGGEVFIHAAESFDELTIDDSREIIADIERIHGKVHLVLYDYLEIFTVKGKYYNSETGERKRREDVANKITNIAIEFNCATATATQANDIKPEKWNNPDFYLTRSDIAEYKGAVKPFSYFLTLNQTMDEYEAGIMRIYDDKFRHHKAKQLFSIVQSKENGRFYDSKRSLELFWDEKLLAPRS